MATKTRKPRSVASFRGVVTRTILDGEPTGRVRRNMKFENGDVTLRLPFADRQLASDALEAFDKGMGIFRRGARTAINNGADVEMVRALQQEHALLKSNRRRIAKIVTGEVYATKPSIVAAMQEVTRQSASDDES